MYTELIGLMGTAAVIHTVRAPSQECAHHQEVEAEVHKIITPNKMRLACFLFIFCPRLSCFAFVLVCLCALGLYLLP